MTGNEVSLPTMNVLNVKMQSLMLLDLFFFFHAFSGEKKKTTRISFFTVEGLKYVGSGLQPPYTYKYTYKN